MEHFLTYSSSDFACDADFRYWVSHGKEHLLVDLRWRSWLTSNPQKAEAINEARTLVLTLAQEPNISPDPALQQMVWWRIQDTLREGDEPIDQTPLIYRWYSKAAVLIFFLAALTVAWLLRSDPVQPVSKTMIETGSANSIVVSTTGESHTFILRDGTSIVLLPGSTLEYERDLGDHAREVTLNGEAYFEVSEENDSPFVVKTATITLAGLATSFNVRSYTNESDTRVQVKRGRVSVSPNDTALPGNTVLLPNHQLTYRHLDSKSMISLVDDPGILIPAANANFSFKNVSPARALNTIGTAYGVSIAFDESAFDGCSIDLELDGLPLFGKLKSICEKTGATYEVIDSRIVIQGQGCNGSDNFDGR